jgi:hypothetical protein
MTMTALLTSPTERNTEEMDLSKLKAHDGELTEVPRGRKPKPNPMAGLYEESLRTGKIRAVDVPREEAQRVWRHLRDYAMELEKGASIQIQRLRPKGSKDKIEVIPYTRVDERTKPGEIVTVSFVAKHERQRH